MSTMLMHRRKCGFFVFFFFSSRRRHTSLTCDWSSDVCSSDLWSDALTALLVTQADRQQKRPTSREIVPVQRRKAILSRCQKRIRKQRATMVGTSDARRKKRGKSDPRVRFLVKECATSLCD